MSDYFDFGTFQELVPQTKEQARKAKAKYRAKKRCEREKDAGRPKPQKCEVCGLEDTIVWDHNHQTGSFRGWICNSCNIALGMVKDNPETLRRLAAYLER